MGLDSTVTKTGPISGDGSTTSFTYTFQIDSAAELEVTFTNSSGTEGSPLVDGADMTVTAADIGKAGGGTITYPKTGAALASNEKLTFRRVMDKKMSADFTTPGKIKLQAIEDQFEKTAKQILELEEMLGRSITSGISDTATDLLALVTSINAAAGNATAAAVSATAAAASAAQAEAASVSAVLFQTPKSLTFSDSPYTIVTADKSGLLVVDTSGGNVTINLPLIATEGTPFVLGIKKDTSDSNTVTVVRNGTDEIDSAASNKVLTSLKETVIFTADNTPSPDNWQTVGISLQQGDMIIDNFVVVTDWTAGVSTTLTLSDTPADEKQIEVYMDGVTQHHNTYTLSGTTLTFDAAIPSGVTNIEVRIGMEVSSAALSTGSVNSTHILDGTIVDGDINASAAITWSKIATTGNVALADMANLVQDRLIGRVTASTGVPEALTPAQIVTVIGSALAIVNDTTPQLGGMLDVNGNAMGDGTRELITFVEDASAVNQLEIENQATGNGPILRATGDDANVDLHLSTKGTGNIKADDDLDVTGNITVTGTVDGVDIAARDATALRNIVEDTTPQLGGALDVNGKEISSTGGTDVDIHSDNNIIMELGDAAGADKVSFRDSGGAERASVDSDGNVVGVKGTFSGVVSASDGAIATPGHAFAGSAGTGMYRSTTTLGFSVDGLKVIEVINGTQMNYGIGDSVDQVVFQFNRGDSTAKMPTQLMRSSANTAYYWFVRDNGEIAVHGSRPTADSDGVTVARLDKAHEWTATQNFNATTLTDAANIAWDASANQVASVTLAGNRTLDNPTNMKDGATYVLTVVQDATGSRTLAYGTAYEWPGGTAPTLSTAANAVDIISFVCNGTKMRGNILKAFS